MERLTKVLRAWEGMRTSDLLRLLQDIAGEDAERRGAGRPALVERGCVWVLVRNRLDIRRFPVPGESFRVTTWPMKGRLGLYPRLFELSAADGELLLRVESLWAVMDIGSRAMFPCEERGVVMEGVEDGRLAPQRRLTVSEGGEVFAFTPAPEQIDENGHMNNAAYLDAADERLPAELRGRAPAAVAIDYEHEIPAGSRAQVRVRREGESCFFEGSIDGRVCFRLREDFSV